MTDFAIHPSLEAALNARYRGHEDQAWAIAGQDRFACADDIPVMAERASFHRSKDNWANLGDRQALRHLKVANADQPALAEIAKLGNLERLDLEWPTVAHNLGALAALPRLRFLRIDSPRKATDFAPLAQIATLRTLIIENAKHLTSIDWLGAAHHLQVIGIEGAMDKRQTVETLAPLRGLDGLKAFLGTSLRLLDRDLMPLAECPSLRFIGIARVADRAMFDRLHAARPDVACSWFHASMWKGASLRP